MIAIFAFVGSTNSFTSTGTVFVRPLAAVMVIYVLPTATAVITPYSLTVATLSSDDLKESVSVVFAGATVVTMLSLCPVLTV